MLFRSERVFKKIIPLTYNQKVLSGKTKTLKVLDFFGLKVPLFIGNIKFEYEESVTKKDLKMLGAKLPITIISKEFKEINIIKAQRTEEMALNQALSEIANDIKLLPIFSAKITDLKWENKGENIEVTMKATCDENIVKEEKIIISGEG